MHDSSCEDETIGRRIAEKAKAVAARSPSRRRVGCVLLRKGRVVVSATNVEGKTHPTQKKFAGAAGEPFKVSLHAEIHALIRSRVDCDTLVVCRVGKNGNLLMSKPCAACQLAIAQSSVRRVVYSDSAGRWRELQNSPPETKSSSSQ